MNCMWLDDDLHKAAKAHPTKYTKLILESGQCLCSALHNNGLGDVSPYGAGYDNHSISRWASESAANWFYLRDYMDALTQHYYDISYNELQPMDSAVTYWENHDVHKTPCSIADAAVEPLVRDTFPSGEQTTPPKAVLDFCDEGPLVESYRKYIVCVKSHYSWFEWSAGKPDWFDDVKHRYQADYRRGQFYVAADESRDKSEHLIPQNSYSEI